MAETETAGAGDGLRDEGGGISQAFLGALRKRIVDGDAAKIRAIADDLHEADFADVLEALNAHERLATVKALGPDFDVTVLTELDETIRDELLEALPNKQLAEGLSDLDTDDAVHLLEDLDKPDQTEILSFIPAPERAALERSLEYPEDSAGRLMQSDFIAVPPFWTVGNAIDHARETSDLPDEFYELFAVDPAYRLIGRLPLYRLLRSKRPAKIETIMDAEPHRVDVLMDQEEVARVFERYNLVSVPVIDESERLVGVITIDDIVDVIEEEADEDMKRLAGVADEEEISDSILATARYRFPWLCLNLLTAIAASAVIALFEDVIAQIVALAVLMPIVASMGGNAGTQSLTVAVRALATKELTSANTRRIIYREAVVGFLNGLGFAAVLGFGGFLWSQDMTIGFVLAAAMVINMLVAGLAGILVPLTLQRLNFDPAISSAVFVTTVTDVVGFFAFLGLAALAFGLL